MASLSSDHTSQSLNMPSISSFQLEDTGPVIGLTLFEPNGSPIGHNHVERLTTIAGIQLPTGGMCNTGVLAWVSGLEDEELKELYEGGRVCGDHGMSFSLSRNASHLY
jgi:hypothetical protein